MSPRRSPPLRKASLDRQVLLGRRVLLGRQVLLGHRVLLDRRGVRVLRESQARPVPLALLVHRDRPDFALPRRVVIRPSAKFPAMRTNTYSTLMCLMQGEALSISMTADYHSHPLVAAGSHALVPAKSS
jgi:hypothetical protein